MRAPMPQCREIAVTSRAGELGPRCTAEPGCDHRPIMRCPRLSVPVSSRATHTGPPWCAGSCLASSGSTQNSKERPPIVLPCRAANARCPRSPSRRKRGAPPPGRLIFHRTSATAMPSLVIWTCPPSFAPWTSRRLALRIAARSGAVAAALLAGCWGVSAAPPPSAAPPLPLAGRLVGTAAAGVSSGSP